MADTERPGRFARWAAALGRLFRTVADGVLLAILVLVLGSAAVSITHALDRDFKLPPGLNPRLLQSVHPGLSQDDIRRLLNETYFSGQFVYAPYTGFTERPRMGAFVSVSPEGFRFAGNPHQALRGSPARKICLLGGSTTFGYGEDDRHTIATYLQQSLDRDHPGQHYSVFNFGHGSFFSVQEAALFQHLVLQGVGCEAAIFIDGVNEDRLVPNFTESLGALFAAYNNDSIRFLLLGLERTTLMQDLANRFGRPAPVSPPTVSQIVQRYSAVRAVAQQLGSVTKTKVIFVVQPIAGYRNGFGHNPFQSSCPPESPCGKLLRARTEAMARLADGKQTYDLTGLFQDSRDLPFLDDVHYTRTANQKIAQALESLLFP